MFQFQFEKEEDLLAVLENRPYHYSRWMVIVQRWEPTVSKDFPSMIPFWIKVQGIPIHLWAEETVEDLGSNLGLFERVVITQTSVKMRVQVNGLLPLIKSSVIEYSNGDKVTATFVYEKLERHCSKCFRLDHELRDCLVAKHQEREKKALELKNRGLTEEKEALDRQEKRTGSDVYHFSATNPNGEENRRGRSYDPREPRYDARRTLEDRRRYRSSYETSSRGVRRENSKERQRSYDSRSSQLNEPKQYQREVSSRPPRDEPDRREMNYYSPIQRGRSMTRREEHGRVHDHNSSSNRSNVNSEPPHIPHETLNEAREEVRGAMLQYTQVADPTESAARRERMQLAAENMEESAIRIAAKAALMETDNAGKNFPPETEPSGERIPATLRLGPPMESRTEEPEHTVADLPPEREQTEERIPISLRLGPPTTQKGVDEQTETTGKRKPGRPPGSRKVQLSPKQLVGSSSRKRKIQQTKAPTAKRKLNTSEGKEKKQTGRARPSNSRDAGNSTNSDNRPICNMVPAISRRQMDFRNPSPLGP